MNTNSLKWFENELPTQGDPAQAGALHGLLARTFEAWISATRRTPRAPEMVRELHEMADRYEATQPGYAADLRFAARSALQAGDSAF